MFAKLFNPTEQEGDQALLVLESHPETDQPSVNLEFEIDYTEVGSPVIGVRFCFDDWDSAEGFFEAQPDPRLIDSIAQAREEISRE